MKKALIVIDFINDIVAEDWKLAGKWYPKFVKEYSVIENTNTKIKNFRNNWDLVVFVKINFKADFSNQPKNSPLFWKAHEFWVFQEWNIGSDFIDTLDVQSTDTVIVKTRVSAFHETSLDKILKEANITNVFFAWVATDLAIESAVRDAHDRDYNCVVLSNSCAAWDIETHNRSLKSLEKIANIV